ncbi:uncharacterized protein MONOS_13745 [Monocercomonoides exilis]|uniref:uncharacterized protein n=1 Tax=Monocercomonoides exilis TaxID=2049356 RepID=UPI003559D404|nr:hypothetical protein MONOS_13745 [Monocercomonoides exilis]|eukprot:MONOS_13745.1-p1 / transcript=MONOS_13745.1 / gene=MONOS_13745 / organism=Monocercomonoides_exilis_PA203 / gene_product=unspecified product / transcript_product=unspecified product / location=Mono_scaffold00876:1091-5579(-) / protein_length=1452 / sequence_SO=supercontig / SO=protein_coding / is_pseudo=false
MELQLPEEPSIEPLSKNSSSLENAISDGLDKYTKEIDDFFSGTDSRINSSFITQQDIETARNESENILKRFAIFIKEYSQRNLISEDEKKIKSINSEEEQTKQQALPKPSANQLNSEIEQLKQTIVNSKEDSRAAQKQMDMLKDQLSRRDIQILEQREMYLKEVMMLKEQLKQRQRFDRFFREDDFDIFNPEEIIDGVIKSKEERERSEEEIIKKKFEILEKNRADAEKEKKVLENQMKIMERDFNQRLIEAEREFRRKEEELSAQVEWLRGESREDGARKELQKKMDEKEQLLKKEKDEAVEIARKKEEEEREKERSVWEAREMALGKQLKEREKEIESLKDELAFTKRELNIVSIEGEMFKEQKEQELRNMNRINEDERFKNLLRLSNEFKEEENEQAENNKKRIKEMEKELAKYEALFSTDSFIAEHPDYSSMTHEELVAECNRLNEQFRKRELALLSQMKQGKSKDAKTDKQLLNPTLSSSPPAISMKAGNEATITGSSGKFVKSPSGNVDELGEFLNVSANKEELNGSKMNASGSERALSAVVDERTISAGSYAPFRSPKSRDARGFDALAVSLTGDEGVEENGEKRSNEMAEMAAVLERSMKGSFTLQEDEALGRSKKEDNLTTKSETLLKWKMLAQKLKLKSMRNLCPRLKEEADAEGIEGWIPTEEEYAALQEKLKKKWKTPILTRTVKGTMAERERDAEEKMRILREMIEEEQRKSLEKVLAAARLLLTPEQQLMYKAQMDLWQQMASERHAMLPPLIDVPSSTALFGQSHHSTPSYSNPTESFSPSVVTSSSSTANLAGAQRRFPENAKKKEKKHMEMTVISTMTPSSSDHFNDYVEERGLEWIIDGQGTPLEREGARDIIHVRTPSECKLDVLSGPSTSRSSVPDQTASTSSTANLGTQFGDGRPSEMRYAQPSSYVVDGENTNGITVPISRRMSTLLEQDTVPAPTYHPTLGAPTSLRSYSMASFTPRNSQLSDVSLVQFRKMQMPEQYALLSRPSQERVEELIVLLYQREKEAAGLTSPLASTDFLYGTGNSLKFSSTQQQFRKLREESNTMCSSSSSISQQKPQVKAEPEKGFTNTSPAMSYSTSQYHCTISPDTAEQVQAVVTVRSGTFTSPISQHNTLAESQNASLTNQNGTDGCSPVLERGFRNVDQPLSSTDPSTNSKDENPGQAKDDTTVKERQLYISTPSEKLLMLQQGSVKYTDTSALLSDGKYQPSTSISSSPLSRKRRADRSLQAKEKEGKTSADSSSTSSPQNTKSLFTLVDTHGELSLRLPPSTSSASPPRSSLPADSSHPSSNQEAAHFQSNGEFQNPSDDLKSLTDLAKRQKYFYPSKIFSMPQNADDSTLSNEAVNSSMRLAAPGRSGLPCRPSANGTDSEASKKDYYLAGSSSMTIDNDKTGKPERYRSKSSCGKVIPSTHYYNTSLLNRVKTPPLPSNTAV